MAFKRTIGVVAWNPVFAVVVGVIGLETGCVPSTGIVECTSHADCEVACKNGVCVRALAVDTAAFDAGATEETDGDASVSDTDASFLVLDAVKDTTVRADHEKRVNDNYGCDWSLMIVRGRDESEAFPKGCPGASMVLIAFDLTGFSAPVARAELALTVSAVNRATPPEEMWLDVFDILPNADGSAWIEGNGSAFYSCPKACTNVDAAIGVAWESGPQKEGRPETGSFAVARRVIPGDVAIEVGDRLQWDITALVNRWITDAASNNGLAMLEVKGGEAFQEIYFGSREGETYDFPKVDDTTGPKLRIEFEPSH